MKRIITALLLLVSPALMAQEDPVQMLKKIHGSSELVKKAYASGQEATVFCGYCHGVDGNSKRDRIPNLAGQNAIYLFTSFEQFGNGKREDYVMSELARSLTLEEQVNIAVYYSQQKVVAKGAESPALVEEGRIHYEKQCQSCHGTDGLGSEAVPRLAGQPTEYSRRSLQAFRSKDPKRESPVMRLVAERLKDREIEALANYLQVLSP